MDNIPQIIIAVQEYIFFVRIHPCHILVTFKLLSAIAIILLPFIHYFLSHFLTENIGKTTSQKNQFENLVFYRRPTNGV